MGSRRHGCELDFRVSLRVHTCLRGTLLTGVAISKLVVESGRLSHTAGCYYRIRWAMV